MICFAPLSLEDLSYRNAPALCFLDEAFLTTGWFRRGQSCLDMSYFFIEWANKRRYTPAAPQGAVLPKSYLKTEQRAASNWQLAISQ